MLSTPPLTQAPRSDVKDAAGSSERVKKSPRLTASQLSAGESQSQQAVKPPPTALLAKPTATNSGKNTRGKSAANKIWPVEVRNN